MGLPARALPGGRGPRRAGRAGGDGRPPLDRRRARDGTPAAEAAVAFAFTHAGHAPTPASPSCAACRSRSAACTGPTRDRSRATAPSVGRWRTWWPGWRQQHPEVRVDTELRRGSAAGYLTRVSEGASMVVVGSRPRHGPGPWGFGGVRRAVVEHAALRGGRGARQLRGQTTDARPGDPGPRVAASSMVSVPERCSARRRMLSRPLRRPCRRGRRRRR